MYVHFAFNDDATGDTVCIRTYCDSFYCGSYSVARYMASSNQKDGMDKDHWQVQLMPNPAHTRFLLKRTMSDVDWAEVHIFDVLGRSVKTISWDSSSQYLEISTSDMLEGMYVVEYLDSEGRKVQTRL